MDAESFQDNGFVVVRNVLDQDLVSFINDTWDQLKKPPYIEAFPYKVGKHIPESSWETPFSYTNFESAPFGYALHVKLQPIIETLTNFALVPTYSFSREYYDNSVLYAHIDRPSCEISATICIDQSTNNQQPWPIWIKNDLTSINNENSIFQLSQGLSYEDRMKHGCTPVNLNPGDMMVYKGCNAIHWRDPLEGDLSRNIFIHFVNRNGYIFKNFPKIENDFRPSLTDNYDSVSGDLFTHMSEVNSLTSDPEWAREFACKEA